MNRELLKKKLTRYGIVILLVTAVIVWPAIIFYPMGALLYRNDYPKDQADAVWVLMGQVSVRPAAAAKAVLSKVSDRIVFVNSETNTAEESGLLPSEQVLTMTVLKGYGIDESKVTIINEFGRASSTLEEAVAMRKMIDKMPSKPTRLVVVTSWPHTSRAGWIIEKALKGTNVEIELLPVEVVPFERSNWWKREDGMIFVFEEYIKWARYIIKYAGRDISP
jgi:uncharacterized SAM-binding protein YcdF (DUF218 family)